MDWLPKTRKKIGMNIPYGYEVSPDDQFLLIPIQDDIPHIEKAIDNLDRGLWSLSIASQYCSENCSRTLSPMGIKRIAEREGKYKTKARPGTRFRRPDMVEKDIAKAGDIEGAARKKANRLSRQLHAVNKRRAHANDVKNLVSKKKTNVVSTDTIENARASLRELIQDREIAFKPNEGPQTAFLASSEDEVFYGGARGGGKSYAMLVDPLRYCHRAVHRALLLRRTMPELRDLIEHSRRLYPKAFPGAKYNEESKTWRFPSGARIEFGYAENRTDALRYQGQSYSWIGVDELPQYPDSGIWNDLRGSLRSVDPEIKPCMRATGNPGNAGSGWVKAMFIDPAPWGEPFRVKVEISDGSVEYITRRFIPARLYDNPYLTKTANYKVMLSTLPETQRKQWLEGNWDVYDNAAFPEFNRNLHVIEPFSIPPEWFKFRCADWGYSSPACVLWVAVDWDNVFYIYREYYGKGLTGDKFAQRIKALEADDNKVQYGIMDSSLWAKRGDVGPTIPEIMAREGLAWRMSDRSPGSRRAGKMELHRRLQYWIDDDGLAHSNLYIFNNCKNLVRTLPTLPLDDNDPEDVDTAAEDHAYDALRYGCMSRPMIPDAEGNSGIMRRKRKAPVFDSTFGY